MQYKQSEIRALRFQAALALLAASPFMSLMNQRPELAEECVTHALAGADALLQRTGYFKETRIED